MAQDIAPDLLEAIRRDFVRNLGGSKRAAELLEAIQSGRAGYAEAGEYAEEVGRALSEAFQSNLSGDTLPDGRMYWNLADRVIRPLLEEDHALVSEAARQVQQQLNEAAGIGIKAQSVPLDQDRVDGILNRLAAAEQYEAVAWLLGEPVILFSRSVVDESVRRNAEFQGEAGLTPRIIRRAESHCCEWCARLAGTYTYPDVPRDVYRRHDFCRCVVEYDPGDGKRQNVHTKQWLESDETLEYRRSLEGIDTSSRVREASFVKGPENVTAEYFQAATPGLGSIAYDPEYDIHRHAAEIRTAQWLHEQLGGDIVLLNESKQKGQKMPDYLWYGRYWDLKSLSSEKAANSAIRHGLQQIRENPGGIILDMGDLEFSIDLLNAVINKRMQWNQIGSAIDILVIHKNKLIEVLRYQKK